MDFFTPKRAPFFVTDPVKELSGSSSKKVRSVEIDTPILENQETDQVSERLKQEENTSGESQALEELSPPTAHPKLEKIYKMQQLRELTESTKSELALGLSNSQLLLNDSFKNIK